MARPQAAPADAAPPVEAADAPGDQQLKNLFEDVFGSDEPSGTPEEAPKPKGPKRAAETGSAPQAASQAAPAAEPQEDPLAQYQTALETLDDAQAERLLRENPKLRPVFERMVQAESDRKVTRTVQDRDARLTAAQQQAERQRLELVALNPNDPEHFTARDKLGESAAWQGIRNTLRSQLEQEVRATEFDNAKLAMIEHIATADLYRGIDRQKVESLKWSAPTVVDFIKAMNAEAFEGWMSPADVKKEIQAALADANSERLRGWGRPDVTPSVAPPPNGPRQADPRRTDAQSMFRDIFSDEEAARA